MFKRKSKPTKIEEKFEVGKANMEFPDYEIKIEGTVPIDYAYAIDERQKRVEKINKDFEEKNELTDEFIEEQNKKRFNESIETDISNFADKLATSLDQFITALGKVPNIEDIIPISNFSDINKTIEVLQDISTSIRDNASKTESKNKYLKEEIEEEFDLIEDLKKEGFKIYSLDEADEDTKANMEEYKASVALNLPEKDRTWYFKDGDCMKKYFSEGGKLDVNNTNLVEAIPAIAAAAITSAAAGAGSRLVDKIFGESTAVLDAPKKRNRSANVKKEDKMYSSDDLWLKVYDDLSSEVENEGPKGEVNKEVDIPRGKRFIGPYAGPGDYDLSVYARTEEDLKWAKKVADHYGLDFDSKKDTNSKTNEQYPYVGIVRDIR